MNFNYVKSNNFTVKDLEEVTKVLEETGLTVVRYKDTNSIHLKRQSAELIGFDESVEIFRDGSRIVGVNCDAQPLWFDDMKEVYPNLTRTYIKEYLQEQLVSDYIRIVEVGVDESLGEEPFAYVIRITKKKIEDKDLDEVLPIPQIGLINELNVLKMAKDLFEEE